MAKSVPPSSGKSGNWQETAGQLAAILSQAPSQLNRLRSGGRIAVVEETLGNQVQTIPPNFHQQLGIFLSNKMIQLSQFSRVTVFGGADFLKENAKGDWVLVEPLDGYKNAINSAKQNCYQLPHSVAVVVLRKDANPTFQDIVAAVVLDYVSGHTWSTYFQQGKFVTTFRGERAQTAKYRMLSSDNTLYLDTSKNEGRELLSRLHGINAQISSLGCGSMEAALVASGQAKGYITLQENNVVRLGAAYALGLGAGGYAIDPIMANACGSFGALEFDLTARYNLLLGASEADAMDIVHHAF